MSDPSGKRSHYLGEWIITVGAIVTVLSLLGSNWCNDDVRQQETCVHEGGHWDPVKHLCVDQ
jgi:hypothetical protein